MANKSKALRRVPAQVEYMDTTAPTQRSWKSPKMIALAIVVVGLIALFLTNKGLLIAGMVNGKPIFRWDLNKVLTSRFGQQTLEQIISERLIADAASKEGVMVTKEEIQAKVAEITAGLGQNANLDELLSMQGMSRSEFESQVRLQLLIRNLLGRDINITEADIDNYIATSGALLASTEPAKLREEAKQAIFDSKVGEKLQVWFEELRANASIQRFL
ncbi:SurA N-terminal domain-containing protein [Candidatus Gottesmanbacteria bacterium]|nr:SurA N-terminal domain-containing protein [Candidatus Gottesmanbacteria bacterium]